MDVKAKVAELGLTIPTAALPVAAYIPTVKTGNLVFTAGQLPLLEGKIPHVGKVGKDVSQEEAKETVTKRLYDPNQPRQDRPAYTF